MSLLQNDRNASNDATLGEDLTQGSSNPMVMIAIIAGLLVVAAGVIYLLYLTGNKPPPAVGEVTSVWAYPLHVIPPDAHTDADPEASGTATTLEEYDQVLVFAQVRVHNQSKTPLMISQVMANITMADGIHSSYAADMDDYKRIFIAYPQLASLHDQPVQITGPLNPGDTTQGMMICAFRLSAADWAKQTKLNFSFSFKSQQPTLVLTPTTPVLTPSVPVIPPDQLSKIAKQIKSAHPKHKPAHSR